MNITFITEPARDITVAGTFDVIVAGGGTAGVIAACKIAKCGRSVALFESKAFLGGVGTMGLPYQGFYDCAGKPVVGGVPIEFVDRLRKIGGASAEFIQCEAHNPFLIVDPEAVKRVCQEMCLDAGVQIHLHTQVVSVIKEGRSISAILTESKSGREAYSARMFIDATGDGDVCARAGVQFSIGREEDSLTQSSTLLFRLDGVDTDILLERVLNEPERYDLQATLPRHQFRHNRKHIMVGLTNLIKKAVSDGFSGLPWDRICYITMLQDSAVAINMVHVSGRNAADARDLTALELEGRAQIPTIISFLRSYVPGFEHAVLTSTAAWSGIRETRHMRGRAQLTAEMVNDGHIPADSVVIGGYPIDIHLPAEEEDLELTKVPRYGISFGCLVPVEFDNLLMSGRCISTTHRAFASSRVMGTCMATGEAAATAAVIALESGIQPADVEVRVLRQRLTADGAIVGEVNS
jgi:glycine/D-amino acid oxidase-like deaminating enzyme